MHPFRQRSVIEQIADHLRVGFHSGHWCGQLPGIRELVRELGVSKSTVESALHLLELEGSLQSGGPGRRKQIVLSRDSQRKGKVLRVGILLSSHLDEINLYSQQMMLGVRRRIENAGHICFFADRCMAELGYKLPRISRMVEAAKADAWVAYSATEQVLEWFAKRALPVMAVGGRFSGQPVASSATTIAEAILASVRTLSELGHRRIVTISPDSWRLPSPSKTGQAFLSAMEECGHTPTSYNLPAWEQTPAGLEKLLESLFLLTPPTALIFVDPASYVAALVFFGLKGIRVPRDVSLICMTAGPLFSLLPLAPAHFKWPVHEHIRRVDRWVKCLAKGGTDLAQPVFPATFEPGETIAPAKGLAPAGR
ncbi:substrate-binding domain-containing protein [Luteolibacter arcticus]|uniref:Substrate-binding domain-containing protein n=1 Tax=Luteolibacter arcticus TaxID=1581411 RepID=A0ABT3GNJ7_9BACT|nr:substrate-binding domain-containing protein [Luteolibacter arcticus]MCW1925068.1 substrate-binding domain-containing protein [Luteolibacter arcticus]